MDRFDEIWKNRFNEGNVPVSDWNTPNDSVVWGGVLSQIKVKKSKRRPLWLWLGLAMILGILLLVLFKITVNERNIDEKVGDGNKIESLSYLEIAHKKQLNNSPKREKQFTYRPDYKVNRPKEKNNYKPIFSEKNSKSAKSTKELGSNDKIWLHQNKLYSSKHKNIKSKFSSNKGSGKEIREVKEENRFVSKSLLSIEFLNLELKALEEKPFNFEFGNLNNQVRNQKGLKSLFLTFDAGASFWKHRISDQYTSDLDPFDFNYTNEFGWFSNLSVSFFINKKVGAYGGIQFEQIQNSSGHNSSLTYDLQTEQANSNSYTRDLATPYGLSELSFRFDRGLDVVDEEVELLVDFKSKHTINNWSIPLGLFIYPIGRNSKISPMISMGVGINNLSISNQVNSIQTNHDAIQYNPEGSVYSSPKIEKWHYDLRMGLGMNYRLSSNWQMHLNYNWTKGLNPVFQQGNYETRIDRHLISLGLVRTLSLMNNK